MPTCAPQSATSAFVPPDKSKLVLATDLDGTFLGGPESSRLDLYRWIDDHRDAVTLIFVTGRDLPFIRDLVATTPVPQPDFVVGDVGTTIAGGVEIVPIEDLERPIAEIWGDAGPRMRALLDGTPGLTPQPTPFRYRLSYFYDPAQPPLDAAARVEAEGFDCLMSADLYFDVLPRGIYKGPTLIRLVEHLGLDANDVLVAGDTLNDLSLFETGYAGVAVGNSEPALRARLAGLPNVHLSQEPGAAGILDALARRGLTTEAAQ
jgi:hydroxymethylpyrimidine pyrophosphatase-like HAD family hydrolase